MKRQESDCSIAELSEALGVSRGGYYRWKQAVPSVRCQQDEVIKQRIDQVWGRCPGPYGYRPVHAHLSEEGIECGRDRTLRLMREMDLVGHRQPRFNR